MGWVHEKDAKIDDEGRTLKIYALRLTIAEIVEHYDSQNRQDYARIAKAFQKLRDLSST
jgi:predicted transcriptional regulator